MKPVIRPEAVDPAWLTAALGRARAIPETTTVTGVTREPCGTGQMADSFRYRLVYEPADSGPATVVGKFSSEEPISRAWGKRSGQYRNEVRFYQELAARLPCAVPRPLHVALAGNEIDFVVLMEDLAPAREVDQLAGCAADDAARVLEQMAALHAGSWRERKLAQASWLTVNTVAWRDVTDMFETSLTAVPEQFADIVSDADLVEAARLVPHRAAWKRVLSEPRCLWHNDLRVDNIMFDAQGGSIAAAIVDWQGVCYACGTIDVAYFMATSLTTEERRRHESELVEHYHGALLAHGADGYTAGACWEDYRLSAIHPLQAAIFGMGAVRRSERGDRMWRNWIERAATMTRDLDSFAVLARR